MTLKRLKYRNLSKNSIGVLIELSKWRETKAQKKRCQEAAIRDDIYELCSAQPKHEDQNKIRSFNRKGGLRTIC